MIHTVTWATRMAAVLITSIVLRAGNKTREQRKVSDLCPEGGEAIEEHPEMVRTMLVPILQEPDLYPPAWWSLEVETVHLGLEKTLFLHF